MFNNVTALPHAILIESYPGCERGEVSHSKKAKVQEEENGCLKRILAKWLYRKKPRPKPSHALYTSATKVSKLEEARTVIIANEVRLLSRYQSTCQEAVLLKKKGEQANALEKMKRAHSIKRQLDMTRSALLLIEKQENAIEEAKMQNMLVEALKQSVGSAKNLTSISEIDKVVDDATELMDHNSEARSAMEQLTCTGEEEDSDERLLLELDSLMRNDQENSVSEEEEKPKTMLPMPSKKLPVLELVAQTSASLAS